MSGINRFRASSLLIFFLALVQVPVPLVGQTATELTREAELRRRIEALEASRQKQLVRLEEALMGAREEVAQARARVEHSRQLQEQVLAHELQAQARARAEHSHQLQEQVLARELQVRAEAQERVGERRSRIQEQSQRVRERVREALDRARDQERRARQAVVRVRGRIRLGVSFSGTQSPELDAQGVRLESVMEETPAEEAGLEEGDIITHLNGHSLVEPLPDEDDQDFDEDGSLPSQRLSALAQELDSGDEVEVRFLRDGRSDTVTFEAAEAERRSFSIYTTGEEGGRRGILRVGPGQGGVWTFSTSGDEIIELKLSDLEDLETLEDLKIELAEMRGLDKLDNITIALSDMEEMEDLKVKLEALELDAPDIRVMARPEGRVRAYTLREGESPGVFSVLRRSGAFGLDLTEMNPGLSEYFDTDRGLLVLSVEEGSTLGLMPGDVILEVDGRGIESSADVRRILGSYEVDETISFTVVRKGQEVQVEGSIR